MMPVASRGPARGRPRHWLAAIALVGGGILLGACSASTIADHMPTAAGGLPEDAPKRPAIQAAYPPVHDRPPERPSILTAAEQKRLEDELAAARARVDAAVNPPAGSARKP